MAEVRDRFANRFAIIPWMPEAPVGPNRLAELISVSVVCAETLKR